MAAAAAAATHKLGAQDCHQKAAGFALCARLLLLVMLLSLFCLCSAPFAFPFLPGGSCLVHPAVQAALHTLMDLPLSAPLITKRTAVSGLGEPLRHNHTR